MLRGRSGRVVARRRPLGMCRRRLPLLDRLLFLAGLGAARLDRRAGRPLIPAIGGDHAMIVLGVLEEVLRADAVPGRERVPRQRLILLDDLERRPPDLPLGAVALEVRTPTVEAGAPPVASVSA